MLISIKNSILRDAKQPGGTYKNVKARVDSGLNKVTTRSDTRKALTNVSGNVAASGFTKALATQRAAITSKCDFSLFFDILSLKTVKIPLK